MRSSQLKPADTLTPGGSSSRWRESRERSSPRMWRAMPLTDQAGQSVGAAHSADVREERRSMSSPRSRRYSGTRLSASAGRRSVLVLGNIGAAAHGGALFGVHRLVDATP